MLWLAMAVLSAFFAGLTAILAKCGIQRTDSDVATAVRTLPPPIRPSGGPGAA